MSGGVIGGDEPEFGGIEVGRLEAGEEEFAVCGGGVQVDFDEVIGTEECLAGVFLQTGAAPDIEASGFEGDIEECILPDIAEEFEVIAWGKGGSLSGCEIELFEMGGIAGAAALRGAADEGEEELVVLVMGAEAVRELCIVETADEPCLVCGGIGEGGLFIDNRGEMRIACAGELDGDEGASGAVWGEGCVEGSGFGEGGCDGSFGGEVAGE